MKLYSGPLSLFTGKVRIALAEKGIPYELVSVPFSRAKGYEPKHPVVLERNPKAQVPVLNDGDLWLYDSTIILEYLEDRYPEPALYPREAAAKGLCRQAEAAADEVFFPHVLTLIREVFYKSGEGAGDAKSIADARAAIAGVYRGFDAQLAGREWICGRFTVADIGWFLTVGFASQLGAAPDPGLANVGAWLMRAGVRPSIANELAGMMAAARQG